MQNFKFLISMNYDDAVQYVIENFSPYYIYPSEIDNTIIVSTDDLDLYRIFVVVENNVIIDVH